MSSLHTVPKTRPDALTGEAPDPSLFDGLDARMTTLVVIALGVSIFLLRYMSELLAPVAFGLLLFYALDPAVDALERLRVPRWLAAAFVLGATLAVILCGVYALQRQALTVINQLPSGARRVAALIERKPLAAPGPLEKMEQAAAEIAKTDATKPAPGVVRVQVEEPRVTATSLLWFGSMSAVAAVNQLLMILFLTYFVLLSDKLFRRKFVELAGPTLTKKKITLEIIDDISSQIGRFLMVQIFTSVVVGVATWVALAAVGLEQAALWGLLAGVFNSIPYYGPLLVSGGLAIVAFLQFGTLYMMSVVAGVALAITALEGWLLTPMLMGRVASMNRVAVFVGLLFWSWAWGVWGLLLAVPMMMSIKVICDHVDDLKPVGRFLGD
ncbi:MAG TPA: AI-2E family transporter [Vicinamibacterales bacterium]|nr:AI-2E family transporter [Vicinamibacterales bacterium]